MADWKAVLDVLDANTGDLILFNTPSRADGFYMGFEEYCVRNNVDYKSLTAKLQAEGDIRFINMIDPASMYLQYLYSRNIDGAVTQLDSFPELTRLLLKYIRDQPKNASSTYPQLEEYKKVSYLYQPIDESNEQVDLPAKIQRSTVSEDMRDLFKDADTLWDGSMTPGDPSMYVYVDSGEVAATYGRRRAGGSLKWKDIPIATDYRRVTASEKNTPNIGGAGATHVIYYAWSNDVTHTQGWAEGQCQIMMAGVGPHVIYSEWRDGAGVINTATAQTWGNLPHLHPGSKMSKKKTKTIELSGLECLTILWT